MFKLIKMIFSIYIKYSGSLIYKYIFIRTKMYIDTEYNTFTRDI